MQEVMDFIKSCGGNDEQAFYMLAKQKNADPAKVLEYVRSILGE